MHVQSYFPSQSLSCFYLVRTIVTNRRTGFNRRLHQVENGDFRLAFGGLVNIGHVRGVVLVVVDSVV